MKCPHAVWITMAIVLFAGTSWAQPGNAVSITLPDQKGVIAGTWQFYNGAEFPGAKGALHPIGNNRLRLEYDFTGGGAYVQAQCTLKDPAPLATMQFRVKRSTHTALTLRMTDSTDQTFQKALPAREKWGFQTLAIDMLHDWEGHWGGPDDGVVRPPIKSVGILVEKRGLRSPKGHIEIASLTATRATGAELASGKTPTGTHEGEYEVTGFEPDAGFGFNGPGEWVSGENRLNADFTKGDSVSLTHHLSLLGKPKQLTIFVNGGNPGNVLSIELGSHFQSFTRDLGVLDGGPQSFTTAMPPEGWTHHGAEENAISYPLSVCNVTISKGNAPAAVSSVKLERITCLTTASAAQTATLFARLSETGATQETRNLSASCQAWNLLDRDMSGILKLTARDWDNKVVYEHDEPWTLPAKGKPVKTAWAFSIPAALKFADAAFIFESDGIQYRAQAAAFAAPLETSGNAELHPESPWGMGVYLYRYGRNDLERVATMAQAAGVKWSREEFSWARMEPNPGEYHFEDYDALVDVARAHGISVYGLLAYWSPWTQAYTEQGIDDFCRWTRATVLHFKDRIKHWEVYNEPNIFFWSGPKELYPVLVKKCYAAIKEADPEAQVLAVSTSGVDNHFIQEVVDAEAPFDILTVHPYRARLNEAKLINDLQTASKIVNGRPVWITEMGWSTPIGGADERTQAQLLARSYLAAIASGVCGSMGWYDFRDDGPDPFYFEHNFGVLRHDYTPKPAYRALATVCNIMAKVDPDSGDTLSEFVYTLRAENATAVWSGRGDAKLTCKAVHGGITVLNLMGDEIAAATNGESIDIALREGCPVFICGNKPKLAVETAAKAK